MGLFVGWDNGASVYTLNPDTWEWQRRIAAPDNAVTPSDAPTGGTYGRFQYIESRNAYVLVNSFSKNVYFYRLSVGISVRPNPAEALEVR